MLRMVAITAFVIAAFAAAGCGDDDADEATTEPTPVTAASGNIAVSMAEFSVTPTPASGTAGEVNFDVTNDGKLKHEFIVAQTELAPDALPVDDKGDVDEEGEGLKVIGEIPDVPVGETVSKKFDMPAGKYVLFCNIEGHYKGGQTVGFTTE
ncbi:MAG: hypothetical protein JHC87_09790 [Thermoleophilaceae bacterium]|nr:hypothetical protein [Thermoleophilaceae bacterium]